MSSEKTNKTKLSIYSIIQKKRDRKVLSDVEIKWVIEELTFGRIPDYQMSALLMAIYINGLNVSETAALTDAMLYSGTVLDFKDKTVIDKHSTGGVGDKTSFILAPIAAAMGVKVPMIAGRGLGHTGGTVDKIESIDGFNTSVDLKRFSELLNKNNLVLIGQTSDIAPADKIIYSLRDVTATVESIPLITASIMSKKLAEGTSGIVMDIKTGPGAFMKTLDDARALAKSISDTALRFNKNIMTIITDMSQPLGMSVGNSLEIIESIETLKCKGPEDLVRISLELAGGMAWLAGVAKSHEDGIKKAKKVLENGQALKKFRELILAQGGDDGFIDDYSKFPSCQEKTEVCATKTGYISSIDSLTVGLLCVDLGGGRKSAKDKIDFAVGFVFHKKVGQKVEAGDILVTIHHHSHQVKLVRDMSEQFTGEIVEISELKPENVRPLIFEKEVKWSKEHV